MEYQSTNGNEYLDTLKVSKDSQMFTLTLGVSCCDFTEWKLQNYSVSQSFKICHFNTYMYVRSIEALASESLFL